MCTTRRWIQNPEFVAGAKILNLSLVPMFRVYEEGD
jgi:hypothetical protein